MRGRRENLGGRLEVSETRWRLKIGRLVIETGPRVLWQIGILDGGILYRVLLDWSARKEKHVPTERLLGELPIRATDVDHATLCSLHDLEDKGLVKSQLKLLGKDWVRVFEREET